MKEITLVYRGVKYTVKRQEQKVAQIGSEENPMMIKGKRRGKVLGMTGSFYKPVNKSKYDANYDRIFGHQTELEIARQKSKTFSMEQDQNVLWQKEKNDGRWQA